jgi:hypothetical protein
MTYHRRQARPRARDHPNLWDRPIFRRRGHRRIPHIDTTDWNNMLIKFAALNGIWLVLPAVQAIACLAVIQRSARPTPTPSESPPAPALMAQSSNDEVAALQGCQRRA